MKIIKMTLRSQAGRVFRNSAGDLRPTLLSWISGNGPIAQLMLATILKYSGSKLRRQATTWVRALEPDGMLTLSTRTFERHNGAPKKSTWNAMQDPVIPEDGKESRKCSVKSLNSLNQKRLDDKAIRAKLILEAVNGDTIMHVSHHLGGGTDLHVRRLTKEIYSLTPTLVLNVSSVSGNYMLGKISGPNFASFRVRITSINDYHCILKFFNVTRIHYHHFHGFGKFIFDQTLLDARPYLFTAHDFYSICPRVNLLKPDGAHCQVVFQNECSSCLSQAPTVQYQDIESWRHFGVKMLEGAEHVICPSVNAASYLRKLVEREYYVVPHDEAVSQSKSLSPRGIVGHKRITVGVLGILTLHKGVSFLNNIMKFCAKFDSEIDFAIIGDCDSDWRRHLSGHGNLKVISGRYSDMDVHRVIMSASPDVILFTNRWPETFSYTLSEALASGLPIIAPNLGAFPERLSGREWTWLYDHRSDPEVIAEMISSIKDDIASARVPAATRYNVNTRDIAIFDSSFYFYEYLGRPRLQTQSNLPDDDGSDGDG